MDSFEAFSSNRIYDTATQSLSVFIELGVVLELPRNVEQQRLFELITNDLHANW
jgi:hypothetical protein